MTVTERRTPDASSGTLPPLAIAGRLDRLRALLDAAACEALVVTELANIRYLTGFTGSAAQLLVTPDAAVFVSDGRYRDQSAEQLAAAGVDAEVVIVAAEPDTAIIERIGSDVERVGLEAESVSWAAQRRWADQLGAGRTLVPTSGLVSDLRLVKDAGEAARIRTACDIADRAFAAVRPRLAERPTEIEFAMELDALMRRLGAEDVSFETIVASGPNGAKPHHRPSDRVVAEGDLVVVDFGALYEGYHSDMTRTVAVGAVGEERRRMLDVVLAAQQAGVEAVSAGAEASDVDAACRDIIDAAGLGEAFLHSTGHGVGLDIHEEPRVSSRSAATLAAGHVVTVEPGVYLPEFGGVRIEDTVLVTEDGCDRLTLTPKDPILS
jgi:Xaa-Pro aminopeptidase